MKNKNMNFKWSYVAGLLLLLCTSIQTVLAGVKEGGGGGGIEIDGKFYSLSQAGLKFDDTPFLIDDQTMSFASKMLDTIETTLPWSQGTALRFYAFDHPFKKLAVADSELYRKIRDAYQKYINTLPEHGTFKLAAYTSDGVTYILPEWENVDPETRALLLVTHEAAYAQDSTADLGDVLRFELAVENLYHSPKDTHAMLATAITMNQLHLTKSVFPVAVYYLQLLAQKNVAVHLGDLWSRGEIQEIVEACYNNANPSGELGFKGLVDPVTLQAHRGIDPDFYSVFSQDIDLTGTIDAATKDLCASDSTGHASQMDGCVDTFSKLRLTANGDECAKLTSEDGKSSYALVCLWSAQ